MVICLQIRLLFRKIGWLGQVQKKDLNHIVSDVQVVGSFFWLDWLLHFPFDQRKIIRRIIPGGHAKLH